MNDEAKLKRKINRLESDLKAARKEIQALRLEIGRDSLTGLLNSREFDRQVAIAAERASRSGRMVGVIYIDLDRFKPINDTYGHSAGDVVLKSIATRLLGRIRKVDLAARLGGDEFAVCIDGVRSEQEAWLVASELLRVIRVPIRLGNLNLEVGASIGCACSEAGKKPNKNLATRLRINADTAMYRAKHAGGGTIQMIGLSS